MIKKILWEPDTCACAIYQDVEYTDGVGEILGYGGTLRTCDVHTQHEGADLYDAILTENKGKNTTIATVMETVPTLSKEPKWSFDEERKLVLDTEDATLEEKAEVAKLVTKIDILKEVK
jgi:hypothetical protein